MKENKREELFEKAGYRYEVVYNYLLAEGYVTEATDFELYYNSFALKENAESLRSMEENFMAPDDLSELLAQKLYEDCMAILVNNGEVL